jgi:hypothetical protein
MKTLAGSSKNFQRLISASFVHCSVQVTLDLQVNGESHWPCNPHMQIPPELCSSPILAVHGTMYIQQAPCPFLEMGMRRYEHVATMAV